MLLKFRIVLIKRREPLSIVQYFHKLFQDGDGVLLYGPYKNICVSIKFLKLIYFSLSYQYIVLRLNSTQLNCGSQPDHNIQRSLGEANFDCGLKRFHLKTTVLLETHLTRVKKCGEFIGDGVPGLSRTPREITSN